MYQLEQVGEKEWRFVEPACVQSTMSELNEALEILEAGQERTAERMLRGIIDRCADHMDALHHLALIMENYGKNLEAYLIEKEAADIGLDALREKFDFRSNKLEWGWLENRPFLRAYHGLALTHHKRGQIGKALRIYEDILSVNPNDNQGIRCLAVACYFELAQPDNVIVVCDEYESDTLPQIFIRKGTCGVSTWSQRKCGSKPKNSDF